MAYPKIFTLWDSLAVEREAGAACTPVLDNERQIDHRRILARFQLELQFAGRARLLAGQHVGPLRRVIAFTGVAGTGKFQFRGVQP